MQDELIIRIKYIFTNCQFLLKSTFGKLYPVAGNIGVFAQSQQEYLDFKNASQDLVLPSNNPNQKYFELRKPLAFDHEGLMVSFTHLYIRKYDDSEYGKNKGDVDFVIDLNEYNRLKTDVMTQKYPGAQIYDRPGWDTIQITRPQIDVVAYLSTQEMAEKVRIKFDNLTNL